MPLTTLPSVLMRIPQNLAQQGEKSASALYLFDHQLGVKSSDEIP